MDASHLNLFRGRSFEQLDVALSEVVAMSFQSLVGCYVVHKEHEGVAGWSLIGVTREEDAILAIENFSVNLSEEFHL